VSEQAAATALTKLAASSDDTNARAKVVRWLLADDTIRLRIDETDLERLVDDVAEHLTGSATDEIARLKTGLATAEPTTIVALFRHPKAQGLWDIPPVRFGPVSRVVGGDAIPASGSWGAGSDAARFAIRVDEPAIGARGTNQALDWLRAVLGALYLAGRVNGGGADTRLGPVATDELAPAVFIGAAGSLGCLAEAMRLPTAVPLDIDELLDSTDAQALISDCLERAPATLVQRRLRQAAPWIQFAFDALSFPDAVLGLGVALESLIGSESKADVVRTIAMRTAFLLREGATTSERALSGSDWRKKATSLYDARSTVAHGRYEQGALSQAKERQIRLEFEELICRVAINFRRQGMEHSWMTDKDLRIWQEQLELA
jgi:hypothetical protein